MISLKLCRQCSNILAPLILSPQYFEMTFSYELYASQGKIKMALLAWNRTVKMKSRIMVAGLASDGQP
jgi:hypothetical protein